ncbi:hypothetical protein A5639_24375 [Mycolicibacterium conceptionense]|nr:hypothetical protein A5639_24375 [Mycolicibacterium conceptionense]
MEDSLDNPFGGLGNRSLVGDWPAVGGWRLWRRHNPTLKSFERYACPRESRTKVAAEKLQVGGLFWLASEQCICLLKASAVFSKTLSQVRRDADVERTGEDRWSRKKQLGEEPTIICSRS